MTKSEKVTENVAKVNESEIDSLANNEVVSKEEEPVKVKTVMERYATAPSVSHLLILILSLLLIAVIITPNIAYLYYQGFGENNVIPFIDFPLDLFKQMGHPSKFPITDAYGYFNSAFMKEILQPLTHQYKNIYPFILSCLGGVASILFVITAIYSFVCVVGGIGRKHTVGLVYTLLAGTILVFAPAIAMSIISVSLNGPTLIPLFPAIGLALAIALVIGVHVTYAKYIKNTITAKEYAALEKADAEQPKEEPIKDLSEVKVREDSINNRNSIVEEVIRQNKERDIVQEEADANEHLVAEGNEVKSEPIVKEVIKEAPVIIQEPEVKKEEPVEEVVETKEAKKPVPPKPTTVKIATYNDLDPNKGLPELEAGLTELGDHAYSKNLDLEFAIIPEGIEKIGPACFANCLNLKMVTLPASLQKISFNGFFACKKLTKIVYNGTKVEWKKIVRGSNWLTSAGTKVVICKDGAISVNPFH